MIKKITMLSLISALAPASYAGTMGIDYANWSSAFLSLEAAYTRNSIDGFAFTVLGTNNTVVSVKDDQLWSGRVAAGLMGRVNDNFAVSGEVGWGYYGRTNLNPVGTGIFASSPNVFSVKNTISGFDVLMGALFTQPCYNLFLKAGALIENVDTTTDASFNPVFFPGATTTFHLQENRTEALPEVKIGGSYLFNENWALTVAYFHAFGSTVQTAATFDPATGSAAFSANRGNPSLDSVLVGVQVSV